MVQTSTQPTAPVISITKEGLEELQAELRDLVDVKMPAAVDRVARAREYGDLAENAEYHSAKDDQELLQARIDQIEDIIAKAHVVKNTTSHTKVGMGSTVVISLKGKKTKKTYHIVGEYESDPTEDKISSVSPLGKALMGKKKGDEVEVQAPAGVMTYLVEELK